MVGYYYDSFVYVVLTSNRHKTRTYGEKVMEVTTETLERWVNDLLENVIYYDNIAQKIYIVPSHFCNVVYQRYQVFAGKDYSRNSKVERTN